MHWFTSQMPVITKAVLGPELRAGNLIQVFAWVAGTQILELPLLPSKIRVSRKMESGAKTRNRTQVLQCGVQT